MQLWRSAISELVVVHPNPGASVDIQVLNCEQKPPHGDIISGQFVMTGVRDNWRPAEVKNDLTLPWRAYGWPGREYVYSYFTACWAALLAHEAFESMLRKDRFDGITIHSTTRIHDPHTTQVAGDGTHWVVMGRPDLLLQYFVGEIEPISDEQAEKEINAALLWQDSILV